MRVHILQDLKSAVDLKTQKLEEIGDQALIMS